MSVKGFYSNGGLQKYDYEALENKPYIPPGKTGLTEEIKEALLQLAAKVAYRDTNGQVYYDELYDALYATVSLVSITASYTQSGVVYDSDPLTNLRSDLVVTAHYDDDTSQEVTNYVLSGTLSVGTSTVTVTYQGMTTTFTVAVTATPVVYDITNDLTDVVNSNQATEIYQNSSYFATLTPATSEYVITTVTVTMGGTDVTSTVYSDGAISIASVTGDIAITAVATQRQSSLTSISASFVQGSAVIYTSDPLSALVPYLTVTAAWSDSSTSEVSSDDYTLSGTLTTGTSTITVSYGGQSDTFTVTVTESALYPIKTTTSGRLAGTGGKYVQYTYESAGTRYLYPYKGSTGSNSTYTHNNKVFTIPAGVTATLKVTVVEQSGSTSVSGGYIWYQTAGGTTKTSAGISGSFTSGSKTGTITPEADLDVGDIVIGLSKATGIKLEISLIVGNDLYIGDRPS